ncbi:MAG: Hpt domain-containing protein [Candidatus Thermoplasmatota archaeon]|nr:Hpt domain-containing protein [Candidatus Thermoplasmatota archaeon]
MDGFDDEEWAEMQEMYITHTSKELAKIQEDLGDMTLDSLRTFGHNIKGSGGMYGFDEVTELGTEIEASAKEENRDKIEGLLVKLSIFLKSKE